MAIVLQPTMPGSSGNLRLLGWALSGYTVIRLNLAFIEEIYRKERCALDLPIIGQSFTENCSRKTVFFNSWCRSA